MPVSSKADPTTAAPEVPKAKVLPDRPTEIPLVLLVLDIAGLDAGRESRRDSCGRELLLHNGQCEEYKQTRVAGNLNFKY